MVCIQCVKRSRKNEVRTYHRGPFHRSSESVYCTPDLFSWTIVIIVISFVFEKCFLGIVSRVVYMIEHK